LLGHGSGLILIPASCLDPVPGGVINRLRKISLTVPAWLRQRNFAPSFERRNFAPTKKPDGLDPLLTACPKLDYRKISDLIPIAGCLADFNKANFGLVIIRTGCRPADPARLQRQRNFAPSSFARLNFQPTYYTDSQNCFDTLI